MIRALLLASLLCATACDLRPEDYSRVEASAMRFHETWSLRIGEVQARQQQLLARAQALPPEAPNVAPLVSALSAAGQTLTELSTTKISAVDTEVRTSIDRRARRLAEDAIRHGAEDLDAALKEIELAIGEHEKSLLAAEATNVPPPPKTTDETTKGNPDALTKVGSVDINDRAFSQRVGQADVPGVNFKPGTADLDLPNDVTAAALMRLIALANSCDNIRLELVAHTAKDGDAKLNRRLSQAQAEKVREYLFASGVAPTKIQKTTGVGGNDPLVPEPDPKTPEEAAMSTDELAKIRAANRRITVKVVAPCEANPA